MLHILYTLIIFPVEQVIELCYVFAFRVSHSAGFSILGVSVAVSTLVLPIYLMAERQQRAEREKQAGMRNEVDNIKAVFRGDKRHMLLSTLYRQNNYHPLYSLRGSLDLFIQIPFFIAAYHFLHNLELLRRVHFLFIQDLGAPDTLLFGINLLPIIMTLINCISGSIYTKEFPLKDKLQLYGMAAVFLILLYNSPAGLVLYWTSNNIYNLIKNILQKIKHARKIIYIAVCAAALFLIVFVLFFHNGALIKRIAIAIFAVIAMVIPFIKKIFVIKIPNNLSDTSKQFFLSSAALLLLAGLVIPARLVASSIAEFSNLGKYISPLPYIGITIIQAAGIALWLLCIYLFCAKKARAVMAFLFTAVLIVCLLNTFVFGGNYGFMLPELHFSEFRASPLKKQLLNIVSILLICAVIFGLFLLKNKKILLSLQNIILIALFCFGVISVIKIGGYQYDGQNMLSDKKVYTFSRTGKNLLIIDLDRAISGYVPYVFEEKPEGA